MPTLKKFLEESQFSKSKNVGALNADVGCQGSVSDGGVFRRTSLWKALEDKTLNMPPPKALPQNPDPIFEDTSHIKLEHFFVRDDAFPPGIH